MKKGKDISAKFHHLYLVHQNLPGKKALSVKYPQYILFIPLQGEIQIEVGRKTIKLGTGQMLYLPPNTPHSFASSMQAGERLIAMIEETSLKQQELPLQEIVVPLNQLIKEVLFYLLIHPKTKNAKSLVNVFCETLAETLTDSLASNIVQDHMEGKIKDLRIKEALQYMRENLEEDLSIDKVAKHAGLSSRNFNRLILKETGTSPKQWLINYRIERSKELLKVPNASVTDVALSVGYNSLGQFISAFRARTGQLPSEYLRYG